MVVVPQLPCQGGGRTTLWYAPPKTTTFFLLTSPLRVKRPVTRYSAFMSRDQGMFVFALICYSSLNIQGVPTKNLFQKPIPCSTVICRQRDDCKPLAVRYHLPATSAGNEWCCRLIISTIFLEQTVVCAYFISQSMLYAHKNFISRGLTRKAIFEK